MHMKRRIFFLFLSLFLFIFLIHSLSAAPKSFQTRELEVFYDENLLSMAEDVGKIYPVIREELEKSLPWKTDFQPRILLVKDRNVFIQSAGSEIFLAYAVPRRYLIVLDASRVYSKPFTLETTLKHELCHLLLHRHIADAGLPRWLDEGVCQWASGGISELLATHGGNALAKAIMADTLMRMKDIETFPKDEASLVLAYEQSKNFIEYIAGKYGQDSIVRILNYAREGYTVDESIQKSLSVSLPELEHTWHAHLRGKHLWFSYLSNNLYTILFLLGGLITIYGFIRFLKKKREYVDEDEGDGL
jgi:Peptidase MA superfamily